ncbi:MAG TPA: DUF3592 domain-containing protein [Chitinophagaceae bacterium]|nr:DUF3592 domain-containing protein [Chitinophagaceae bacterium]
MNKTVVIIYLVIFALYIVFTRTPDFFDSETTSATIHYAKDSAGNTIPFANYTVARQNLKIDARYLFRDYYDGDACTVRYNTSQPKIAAVDSVWGYWITWQELMASIILAVVLWQIAKAITSNPTPEGLLSELEDDGSTPRPPRKRKYD